MTKPCMTKRNRKSRLMPVMILVSYPQAVPLAQRRRRRLHHHPPRYAPTLTLAHVCSRVLQWLLRRCVASVPGCQARAHDVGQDYHDVSQEHHDVSQEHHDAGQEHHDVSPEHHDAGQEHHDVRGCRLRRR